MARMLSNFTGSRTSSVQLYKLTLHYQQADIHRGPEAPAGHGACTSKEPEPWARAQEMNDLHEVQTGRSIPACAEEGHSEAPLILNRNTQGHCREMLARSTPHLNRRARGARFLSPPRRRRSPHPVRNGFPPAGERQIWSSSATLYGPPPRCQCGDSRRRSAVRRAYRTRRTGP